MKKILAIVFIGGAIIMSGCNSEGNNAENASIPNTYDIELLDGKKWTVNPEMMQYIRRMESDIQAASKSKNPDYDRLGEQLNKNIGLLTSNCTMTGKAHDELHKWLVPFIGMVKELNEVDSDQKAEVFKSIKASMKEFRHYFQ